MIMGKKYNKDFKKEKEMQLTKLGSSAFWKQLLKMWPTIDPLYIRDLE